MSEPLSTNPTPPAPDPRRSSAWPFATVLIVLLLVVGAPAAYLVIAAANAPARMTQTISMAAAEALRPKLTMKEIVLNTITDLHKENKLVVFTAEVSTDVTREEGDTSWGMYWGTNVACVAVKNARVQYVIDLEKLETSDFVYNEQAKILVITLPRPHVDTSMVAIDPGHIQTLDLRGGWGRFDKWETRDHAIAELRPKIVSQAQAPYVQELAQSAGIETATHLMQPLADSLSRDGAAIRVAYRN